MRRWTLLIAFASTLIRADAQLLAASSDVTQLALQLYNIGAELSVGGRSTIFMSGTCTFRSWRRRQPKFIALQPEYRYYFSGRTMYRHFVGAAGIAANYDITWDGKRHDGNIIGAGLTCGYVFTVTRRFTIDAHAGLGVARYHHLVKTTSGEDMEGGPLSKRGTLIIPTKIGLSVAYIIR